MPKPFHLPVLFASAIAALLAAPHARATTQTFNYTGTEQNFVVPAGVTSITVTASGAQGGAGGAALGSPHAGGNGGTTTATIPVTAGETLSIFVGGAGVNGGAGNTGGGSGGYNGGGAGANGTTDSTGAGGGGASDVRQGGNGLGDRVVVAGGGGGGGAAFSGGVGGNGGNATGADGASATFGGTGGGGGTSSTGGAGGSGQGASGAGGAGALALGGAGSSGFGTGGGGGGGGYYGGGGGGGAQSGGSGGGGGGSSFAIGTATNVSMTQGDHTGDGQVVLDYTPIQPPVYGITLTAAKGNERATFTLTNTGNTTTSFRLGKLVRVTGGGHHHHGPKPPKPRITLVYLLDGVNITNAFVNGAAATTLAPGAAARLVVKVKSHGPHKRRTVRVTLSATSEADPSVSATARTSFGLKAER
jgi:hypothetical protein